MAHSPRPEILPVTNEQRLGFLKDEYLLLQQTYEDFDRRTLTIKSWAVTVALGAIVLGFQYEKQNLWPLAAVASLLFWLIEARWKTFQYAHANRIRRIEGFFRGEPEIDDIVPFQIYHEWFESYAADAPVREYEKERTPRSPHQKMLENAWLPLVRVPYLHIVLGSLALWGLHLLGVLPSVAAIK